MEQPPRSTKSTNLQTEISKKRHQNVNIRLIQNRVHRLPFLLLRRWKPINTKILRTNNSPACNNTYYPGGCIRLSLKRQSPILSPQPAMQRQGNKHSLKNSQKLLYVLVLNVSYPYLGWINVYMFIYEYSGTNDEFSCFLANKAIFYHNPFVHSFFLCGLDIFFQLLFGI